MSVVFTENLDKRFGSVKALNKLDLSLDAGEPIALIGPNGAGKTTLFSVLCGYLRPSSGTVKVLGEQPGSSALIGRVTSMPQDALMDPHFSVGRQLTHYARLQGLSKKAAKLDKDRVLDIVQLSEASTMKPEALSHGMRKRIALAQALLGKPELVLLDEPTAGIDPPNVKIIRDLVSELSDSITFIVSSHNLDELERLCKSVVYLEQGELKQTGSVNAQSDDQDTFLTVRLAANSDDNAFAAMAKAVPGVHSVTRLAQGDFRIHCDHHAVVDEPILARMREEGIKYRQLVRGRSLEDRLYGGAGS